MSVQEDTLPTVATVFHVVALSADRWITRFWYGAEAEPGLFRVQLMTCRVSEDWVTCTPDGAAGAARGRAGTGMDPETFAVVGRVRWSV
ncbi:hypothetical protein [Mycobacterium tuberculosis]|uniref:hypothetical protein n=1 Tax=Mycobacterium tuberculosis TaxID=1773 RepID=UPI003A848CD8